MAEVIYRHGNDQYMITLDSENVIDQIFKKNSSGVYVQLTPKNRMIKVFLNNHNSVAVRMSFKRFYVQNSVAEKKLKELIDKSRA